MMTSTPTHSGVLKQKPIPVTALMGLDYKPIGPDEPNRFFFTSPLISQRLSILNHMVGSSSQVFVVIGERGSGKTTLMNQFINDACDRWQMCRIRLKPRRPQPKQLRCNLNNRIVFLSKKDCPPSVIIDDAHELSPTELKWLIQSAWQEDGSRRLQSIVLFAEPQIRSRFGEIYRWLPAKAVIDKIYMTPLTEKQTTAYLRHRFRTAGFFRKEPFSVEQINTIYKLSGGLPGWINGEAFMLLRRMCANGQQRFSMAMKSRQTLIQWKHKLTSRFHFLRKKQFAMN